jgi:hypothetical protein
MGEMNNKRFSELEGLIHDGFANSPVVAECLDEIKRLNRELAALERLYGVSTREVGQRNDTIRSLQAIVERLQKTKDDVSITPGMQLFHRDADEIVAYHAVGDMGTNDETECLRHIASKDCFSTEEAAKAAQEGHSQ